MAISTPAQKPRGEASRTRSTSTPPGYLAQRQDAAGGRSGGPASILVGLCPCPAWWRWPPGRRPPGPACCPATRSSPWTASSPETSSSTSCSPTRPSWSSTCAGAASSSRSPSTRAGGEPLGIEVDAALFDQVRTCDNHCEFCFIHQLPKGMRRSLYIRDDDYRLSFLYGNFTTLTRFTEADLERVVTEGLSPLWVSIHATDPEVRARMLRNRRGATSLRWLRALLDHGIEVHGQVVVCPGVNDGAILDDTLAGVLDRYPELASVACVPLGVSRFNVEAAMRPHTVEEAARRGGPGRGLAGDLPRRARPPPGVRGRRVLPAGRAVLSPPGDLRRPSPSTRTASAWRAPSRPASTGAATLPPAARAGSSSPSTAPPPAGYRAPRAPGHGHLAAPGRRAGHRAHRRLRRRGARAAGRRRPTRTPRCWPSPTGSSAATSASPGC